MVNPIAMIAIWFLYTIKYWSLEIVGQFDHVLSKVRITIPRFLHIEVSERDVCSKRGGNLGPRAPPPN